MIFIQLLYAPERVLMLMMLVILICEKDVPPWMLIQRGRGGEAIYFVK